MIGYVRNRDKHGMLWTFPLPSEQESLDAAFIDDGLNELFVSSGCLSTEVQPIDRRDTGASILKSTAKSLQARG
jgi:hypothetical protein